MITHPSFDRLNAVADGIPGADGDAAHVHGCPDCARTVGALRALGASARALPREIAPAGDLWPAVRRGIEGGRVVPLSRRLHGWGGRRVLATVAAAAVLVVATSLVTIQVMRSTGGAPVTTADAGTALNSGTAMVASLAAIDRSYRPTLAELSAALAANRGRLAPATMARVERNLQVIDAAIDEIREALARDPANADLAQMLGANYRQKVELLRRASEWVPITD